MFMKCKVTVDTSHYPKEGPWELPEGWCWRYLSDIGTWQSGATPSRGVKAYFGGSIPWLKTGDLNDDYVKDIPERITDKALKETSVKLNPEGSVLIAMYGATIGKVGILTFPATTNQACCACSELCGVDNRFLFYFLISHKEEFIRQAGGGAQPNISKEIIVNTPIPVPPAEEQKRIVSEIEMWLGVLKDIDKSSLFIHAGINNCKARILDLAIHGKLVPQDPSDEPAIELLKRINPNFTPSDNLHYEGDLPNRWSIIRLGDVIDVISGTSYQKTDIVPTDSGIRILRGGNIQNGMIVLCEDDVFVNHRLSDKHLSLYRGDIALVASTGSRELIGKAAIAKRDYQNTQIGAFLRIIRPKATELSDYLGILFQSDYYKKHIQEAAKGTNINNIKTSYLTEFVVPLPPIKEQQRIIEKVNALFLILNYMADLSDC